MKCEKCQELVGDFLDGTLTDEDHALFGKHLEECLSCADVREEMNTIVLAARECGECLETPPDERALWLRIRNTIESERDPDWVVAAAAPPTVAASAGRREGFWSRLMGMRWEMTLPQLTTAVAGIIVAVALTTAVGVQRLQKDGLDGSDVAGSNGGRNPVYFNSTARFNGDEYERRQEELLSRQQVSISYWQQRVEQRKGSWNPRMRDSFDRSINVIDEAVSESLNELKTNPHDEVAEEMLNGALRNKLEFLKEFSEQ